MTQFTRFKENPILVPNPQNSWEADGAFNGCPVFGEKTFRLVYRALSSSQPYGFNMRISSVGYAQSPDGVRFGEHQLLIKPEEEWEIFGCEDPRVTYFNGHYFIFYTALSTYPFTPEGIKIGLAITSDFQKIEEKHLVTFFNSKAMALFPEPLNGKLAAILTVDTDMPPAKIALAYFEKVEDIWSPDFWVNWHASLNAHVIPLLRSLHDHLEVGAPPVKTKDGWLLIYSYIRNYFSQNRTFGIEAVLLDLHDPQKIIGRTASPILIPEKEYEMRGNVPNVIFPSGALVKDKRLLLYYGATDTTCCLAIGDLGELLNQLREEKQPAGLEIKEKRRRLQRFPDNPLISPIPELAWQSRATFNPAAIYEGGKAHILYRAMSQDNTSVLGYASSEDGFHLNERLPYPVYVPREDFEKKTKPYAHSGCEDPRLTRIEDRIYMCYTAFDGTNPFRVAFTSIALEDFLSQTWNWEKPKLISQPGIGDKNTCFLPEKITNQYFAFHRLGVSIWVDAIEDLNFPEGRWLGGKILANPRKDKWDNVKIGIAAPPLKTKKGWLLLYHGVSDPGNKYKAGAMLLDLECPTKILGRTDEPILEPELPYEIEGEVRNVVFPCGTVIIKEELLVYYGGGDQVVGVASIPLDALLTELVNQ